MSVPDSDTQADEAPTKQVEPHGTTRFKIPRVQVDRKQIPQLSSSSSLTLPGVCEYDQSTFEENLIKQLETQLSHQTLKFANSRARHSTSKPPQPIKQTQNQTNDIDTLLSDLPRSEREMATIRLTTHNPRPRSLSPIHSDSSGEEERPRAGKRSSKRSLSPQIADDVTEEAYLSRLEETEGMYGSDEVELVSRGLFLHREIWSRLLQYQKQGVRWLCSLHKNRTGGILGDEMGLGKTVQVCSFLNLLDSSQLPDEVSNVTGGEDTPTSVSFRGLGHTLIVCPATLLSQWVRELHAWAPRLRVVMLHSAGDSCLSHAATLKQALQFSSVVIVTSYQMLRIMKRQLLQVFWHYSILDEAHRIRNPNADITQVCKQLRTPHRLALSGCPVQNNLKELWSLVDFVSPGALGTLPVFMETLAVPITQGGYASATDEQVQIAYRCACVLKDTLKPYLLRRIKQEVEDELRLPEKSERVLFCRPTRLQALLYKRYLRSEEATRGYRGGTNLFVAICIMRKICNHPDILIRSRRGQDEEGEGETALSMAVLDLCQNMKEVRSRALLMPSSDPDGSLSPTPSGHHSLSGKMRVVRELLLAWRTQGHRVLVFSQTRQTLDLLEQLTLETSCSYLRMDGSTSVAQRSRLVRLFNGDPSIFLFLLTTRVGGIGLNLTGANRVIIFDPDWNPSTDHQARERAWRIGQEREVSVFRLVTSGTVEEKMYQRQIFKQYLTNRVLKDPRQRRLFTYSDIHELFSFDDTPHFAETPALLEDAAPPGALSTPSHPFPDPIFPPRNNSTSSVCAETDEWSITQEDLDTLNGDSTKEELTDHSAKKQKLSKHKKPKSKRRPRKRTPVSSSEVDGQQIRGVDQVSRSYQASDLDVESASQDNSLLRELLQHCSLDQTLRHDLLEEATERDCVLVKETALRKAEAAAAAIQRARERLESQPVGVPTWTGQRGGVPLLVAQRRDATPGDTRGLPGVFSGRGAIIEASSTPSSSDLLSSIRERNATEYSDMDTLDRDTEELIRDLHTFLSERVTPPGQASTDEILTNFSYLPENQSVLFRAILKKICSFSKVGGCGVWKLKLDYL